MTITQWAWAAFVASVLILIIALKRENKIGAIISSIGAIVSLIVALPNLLSRMGPFLDLQSEAWPALFAPAEPSSNPVPWVIFVLAVLVAAVLGATKKLAFMSVAIIAALVALFFALPGLGDGIGPFLDLQGESFGKLF